MNKRLPTLLVMLALMLAATANGQHLYTPIAANDYANVVTDTNSCPAPTNVHATTIGATTADIDWTDLGSPTAWMVEYGPEGFAHGSALGTTVGVTSHPVHLVGLNALTRYDLYVRPICSAGDTGSWSDPITIATTRCDNTTELAVGSDSSTSHDYRYPVNSFYNYSLSEIIVDSTELGAAHDLYSISFYYVSATPLTHKDSCTIYLQPTTLNGFDYNMVPLDPATAVKVYTGPLNCTQGWNTFVFEQVYSYDGNGNLLLIIDDNSGEYLGPNYSFKTQEVSTYAYKTIFASHDAYNIDPLAPNDCSHRDRVHYRPVMKFAGCGPYSCSAPIITSVTSDYESITLSWTGFGTEYEVSIRKSHGSWPDSNTHVSGNSYTFTGLTPGTSYYMHVRQDCTADSVGFSDWRGYTKGTVAVPEGSYRVVADVNNPAWGTVTGGGIYREGEECTLTAIPASEEYEFLRWRGKGTENPYTFTVTHNTTLVAVFGEVETQGIADIAEGATCTIYPNPATHATTISVTGINGKARIAVIDMSGRTMADETLTCNADCQKVMHVDDLAQGTYFVHIVGEQVNMVKKLIVR